MEFILLFTALAAGMLAPLQAGLNGKMGRIIGDPYYAAMISFAVGTLSLLVYLMAWGIEFESIRKASSAHWTVWSAGILGAVFVSVTIVLMPRLGSTLTFSLVVTGQLSMALILDHYGLLGVSVQPVSWQRLFGIILILAGVVLIRRF